MLAQHKIQQLHHQKLHQSYFYIFYQYNLLERYKMEKEYLPVFDKYQLGTTIWSPLGSGILSGKYIDTNPSDTRTSLKGYEFIKKKYESDSYIDVHNKVKQLKEQDKIYTI